MRFPTVHNDVLPANMIAFSMPVKAGDDGMMAFRYDCRSRTLFTDMKGEDEQGLPAQFDNVKIDASSTIPELVTLWNLTNARRAMYDTEYLEATGQAPPAETPNAEREAFSESTPLPDVNPPLFQEAPQPEQPKPPMAMISDEQLMGEYYTEQQLKTESQLESDRQLIDTLEEFIETFVDPKEKILPIIQGMIKRNREQWQRNFGEVIDEGLD